MAKIVLALFLVLQVMFWFDTYEIKPKLGITPHVPTELEVAALSFGDKQLYFRILALNLQMAGDTFGRSTPLKDYDYPKLLEWFRLMDRLDYKSNFIPSIAAYYFSRSQDRSDVKYVLDYLEEHSYRDPEANWWWLSQSLYLANNVLGDKERALRMAKVLRGVKADMPLWARQMEVFMQEDLGDKGKAEKIMCEIFRDAGHLKDAPKREQDFMIHFFEERMKEALANRSLEDVAQLCARKYFSN